MKQEAFEGKQEVEDQEQFVWKKILTAILSQEDKPGTHGTPAQIPKMTEFMVLLRH